FLTGLAQGALPKRFTPDIEKSPRKGHSALIGIFLADHNQSRFALIEKHHDGRRVISLRIVVDVLHLVLHFYLLETTAGFDRSSGDECESKNLNEAAALDEFESLAKFGWTMNFANIPGCQQRFQIWISTSLTARNRLLSNETAKARLPG